MFQTIMNIISLWALPIIIILILTMGLVKKFLFMRFLQTVQKTVSKFLSA